MRKSLENKIKALIMTSLAGLVAAVNGCDGWKSNQAHHVVYETQNTIRVVALNHPLTQLTKGQGFEHDLIWHFANSNSLKVEWSFKDRPEDVLAELLAGRADIAAGRWSQHDPRLQNQIFLTSLPYGESPAVLVCPREKKSQDEDGFLHKWMNEQNEEFIEDQSIRIGFRSVEISEEIKSLVEKDYPKWSLLETTNLKKMPVDCFLTDNSSAKQMIANRPWLRVTKNFAGLISHSLVFTNHNSALADNFASWFQIKNRSGFMTNLRLRYEGYQRSLTERDRIKLIQSKKTRLPELLKKFKTYSVEFKLPWQLVAAVAFQESHWNQDAESYTGVRGLMQLTQETAKHLGVKDREDLEQSLWGGAKYLKDLIDSQPTQLHIRDKIMLALIAYNIGPYRLKEVQRLTEQAGFDPYSFWALRHQLLNLTNIPVRGLEAVQFTERVLGYYDLLLDSH